MWSTVILFLSLLAAGVNCGYPNAASNRTKFPLKGGFCAVDVKEAANITLHVTTVEDPVWSDFATSNPIVNQSVNVGVACFRLDLTKTPGVKDGQHMSIQLSHKPYGQKTFWECADVILTSDPVATPAECLNSV